MNRHIQPGTAAAFLVAWFAIAATGWGWVSAIAADHRADRSAHQVAVPAAPITVTPVPSSTDHLEMIR